MMHFNKVTSKKLSFPIIIITLVMWLIFLLPVLIYASLIPLWLIYITVISVYFHSVFIVLVIITATVTKGASVHLTLAMSKILWMPLFNLICWAVSCYYMYMVGFAITAIISIVSVSMLELFKFKIKFEVWNARRKITVRSK